MRHHIRCFESEAAYTAYKNGDDKWLPRVAFIPSTPTEIKDITIDTPGRLVFNEFGKHFIEICNGGIMYFNDIQDPTLANDSTQNYGWYRATFTDGVLNITTPQGGAVFDPSTGELDFDNYPDNDY